MWDEIADMPGEIFDITDNYSMPKITYEMNFADPNYCEWIFSDGQYIGEIYGTVLEGYELRKVNMINIDEYGSDVDLETIAHFETVCDAKDFVNQAGTL